MTTLLPPVRNRYFYGKLLDADHLELEQRYFLERERLINRLTLGAGVLCGLGVEAGDGNVVVSPGVAIDGLGREIVVERPVTVDPWALGENGHRATADLVVLLLCYHECEAEPAPVLVADCELREECVPSVVRERFLLRAIAFDEWKPSGPDVPCEVLRGKADGGAGGLIGSHIPPIRVRGEPEVAPAAGDRLPFTPHDLLRAALFRHLPAPCAVGPECVPLGLVLRITQGDATAYTAFDFLARTTIYSNSVLLELILCLAERIEECCADRATTNAPVVNEMFPAPAEVVTKTVYQARLEDGAFSLTFDRDLDVTRLQAPADWMRVVVIPVGTGDATKSAWILPVEARTTNVAGDSGKISTYGYAEAGQAKLKTLLTEAEATSLLVAVVIRSDEVTQIVDTSDPPQQLAAEFPGTELPLEFVRELWTHDATDVVELPGAGLSKGSLERDPQKMPSLPTKSDGDGGLFHAWFEVDLTS